MMIPNPTTGTFLTLNGDHDEIHTWDNLSWTPETGWETGGAWITTKGRTFLYDGLSEFDPINEIEIMDRETGELYTTDRNYFKETRRP
jgi:hypothetical protein